jgi:DNA-binding response OmpR family regulator
LARINAIQRRKLANKSNTIIKFSDIELDLQQIEVKQK